MVSSLKKGIPFLKKCNTCNEEKNESEFCKSSRSKDKLYNSCRICVKIKCKKWREANPEKLKISWKKSRENKNLPIEIRKTKNIGLSREDTNRINRIYYQLKKTEIIEKRKKRIRTKEIKLSAILITKRYREKNRETYNEYQRKYRRKQKIYHSVSGKVRYAIQSGKLIKPFKCEICSQEKPLQAHHEDYSKPLEVKWLCLECHNHQHGKLLYK